MFFKILSCIFQWTVIIVVYQLFGWLGLFIFAILLIIWGFLELLIIYIKADFDF